MIRIAQPRQSACQQSRRRYCGALFFGAVLGLSPCAHAQNLQKESAPLLDELVVTATATETTLEETPASVAIVKRDDLVKRPVQDLADAVQGLPGVHVGGVGLTRRGISIRGMGSDYTLTLVNGQRINQSGGVIGHSDSDLGWVPSEAIERVEVVRGPMSSLYGSDALGGVVNVITRAATDEWRGSFSSRAGWREDGRGGDSRQVGFYVGGPLLPGVLGLNVYGETRRRDNAPLATDEKVSDIEGRDAKSLNVALNWTPSANQRIDLSVGRVNEDRERGTKSGTSYYNSYDAFERKQWSLSHKGKWNNASSQVRIYGASLDKTNTRDVGTPTRPQVLNEEVADARLSLALGERHLLTVGGELRKEKLEDSSVNELGKADITHKAVFVQDEFALAPNWSLVLGDRLDDHEKFGLQHSPRAYLVHQVSNALTIKGGLGRGFKAPNLKLLSPDYYVASSSFSVRGNPDLKPEISTSYELGAEYRAATGWSLQATVFQNNVRDLIQTYCERNCDAYRELVYQNVERARIRGLELGTSLQLLPQLALSGNYTWLQARNQQTGQPLATQPRHQANVRLGWQPAAAWQVDLRGQYTGSQMMYSSSVQYALPAHSIWSLDVNYRFSEHWTLSASVENLGNTLLTDKTTRFNYAVPGRSVFLGITASF
ncbi:TonB-dependent receptor [Lampropedia puyangensis]|uniref:TonB-dependent receptor n=1 Tax=Lampropedia puyangensis TaxID=1330072 RepID=A0A4S8EVG5_9BURK|nr:TonB-dependent receptor [Lampropedia puyangensis]